MQFKRREFIRATGSGLLALTLGQVFSSRQTLASNELIRDSRGILDLPPGFRYKIIDQFSQTMSDGYRVPGLPDGMACFAGDSAHLILMRNHELGSEDWGRAAYSPHEIPSEAYDQAMTGAVSRVVIRRHDLQRVSSNLVLTGTSRNCAGGSSPWGWLSCEEDVAEGHGYTFLCNPFASRLQKAVLIKAYGRFNHEAVCIDPNSHVAYLTEDRSDSVLYRFLPAHKDRPFEGRLQAFVLKEQKLLNTATGLSQGDSLEGYWVDLQETDPEYDTLRYEAHGLGAAIFSRGEGIWYGNGSVYFVSTNGGAIGRGQIFRLHDDIARGVARLELLCESRQSAELDCPDNITVSPHGAVFVAEDGSGEQFVRMIDSRGGIHNFARNALSISELAGVCFDPLGEIMFLNIQHDGITLAITGPFTNFYAKALSYPS